ncbi:hypothetical protein LCGC14_0450880 [marine sediment metagenome]|uniref:Uncharacterized protein n=1 Tax=marine sediment metagenome TaxID=412755 RepID=A0A0F9T105_9ZZZZ
MKWIKNLIRNWLKDENDVHKFLAGKDGSNFDEYQKGVHLKQLTQQEGWPLLKGIFMETIRIQNLDMQVEVSGKKVNNTGAIYAKGLALASALLIEIEEINLQELKAGQKELDRDANDRKLDAISEEKDEPSEEE